MVIVLVYFFCSFTSWLRLTTIRPAYVKFFQNLIFIIHVQILQCRYERSLIAHSLNPKLTHSYSHFAPEGKLPKTPVQKRKWFHFYVHRYGVGIKVNIGNTVCEWTALNNTNNSLSVFLRLPVDKRCWTLKVESRISSINAFMSCIAQYETSWKGVFMNTVRLDWKRPVHTIVSLLWNTTGYKN